MELSVITVTWNSEDFIADQIRSVALGCNNVEYEHILIDNASNDGTAQRIMDLDMDDFVRVIVNNENKGFGVANNQGAEIAQGQFFLILNPDMRLEPNSIRKAIDLLKSQPNVGILSCKLVNENGSFTSDSKPRRFPQIIEQIALIFKIPHIFPQVFRKYIDKDFDSEVEQKVDSVRGSFMLIRREVYEKLGFLFDPRYFLWFEEVDLCRETYKLGYSVLYSPIITCTDYVGLCFKKQSNTVLKQIYFTDSMLKYFKKWEPWYKWIWIFLFRPIGIGLTWFKDFFYNKFGLNLLKLSRLKKQNEK